MLVDARPFPRHRGISVLRRSAAAARLLEQRFVMLLGGLERIRAHDRLARVVALAIAPCGRSGIDGRSAASALPEILDRDRAQAAEVARIAPEPSVGIEVAGREEVALERDDAFRGVRRSRRSAAAETEAEPEATEAASRVVARVVQQRRRAPDALETDVGRSLRQRGAGRERGRNAEREPLESTLHGDPPSLLFVRELTAPGSILYPTARRRRATRSATRPGSGGRDRASPLGLDRSRVRAARNAALTQQQSNRDRSYLPRSRTAARMLPREVSQRRGHS